MSSPAVHWHEGMFLRPQHFQTAQRNWVQLIERNVKWDHHYNWGLRSLDLDLDSLTNHRCVVRTLEARLRDGAIVAVSEDDPLQPVSLRSAFEQSNSVTVYLGVPSFHLGRPNAVAGSPADDARFAVDTLEFEDENSGANAQSIPVRRLNLKLLLSTQSLSGFDVIPLARLEKSSRAEATPQLDATYFPPLLACDAWRPLAAGILQSLHDRIGKKMELLADQVVSRGITFESNSQGDALTFNQLRELNQAFTTLGVLAFAQGVHPLQAYEELCRLVGQLAIFGKEHRPPDLPVYDHDDLARCFFQARQHVDTLLDIFVEPEYRERAFVGAGLRMQASLEPAWLEPSWQMYLAVRSPLDAEECVKLLTKPGNLDMKIGSSHRVDDIYRQGAAGLRFTHVAHPPRALPMPQGQVYFQIMREAKDSEWQHVQRSLTLAIRLNESLIAGNIQDQRILSIRHGGQTVPLHFILYLLPV
ncbi:MAG: type VI secretion system baseplate subunit TssK [Planctomycetes bacterium]|nr:type VI secretion system baseplate subunit TssK [Planctomycetota bacterium]